MTKAPKSDADRLAGIQAEITRLEARAAKQRAVIRAKESRTRQRRAFLLGDCLLAQEVIPDAVARDLARMLGEFLKRPADREVMADWLAGASDQLTPAPAGTQRAFITGAAALARPAAESSSEDATRLMGGNGKASATELVEGARDG